MTLRDYSLEKVYGSHSVRAVFLTRPHSIRRVLLLDGKKSHLNQEFIALSKGISVQPEILKWNEFLQAANFTQDENHQENHQGVCIFTEPRKIYTESDLVDFDNARVILALDQLSNPRNLATIIRSAAFFGVDAIILLKNRSVEVTPEVTRIAVGGTEFVKFIQVINLARSLDTLKSIGYWVYGLDERGEKTLAETDLSGKVVLVVGAEGEGLRVRTGKFCDVLVRIPGGRKGLESLNAGIATSIALAEVFRKSK